MLPYWNHNAAYYPWIRRTVKACARILDVGCGDGALARYLAEGSRTVIGIDPSADCIRTAAAADSGARFACVCFEDYPADTSFDAILFVASLHHMDAYAALQKAAAMLQPGGMLVIVGLSSPSSPADWILELLRVIPVAILSKIHHMRDAETLNVPVSYALPPMDDVRRQVRALLPGARIRRGLYYRYLVTWEKD